MDKYKIRIYPSAKTDLNEIISYLNTLSPQAALRYYDLIVEKISNLDQLPERCPFVRDVALKAKGYRYLIVENYLVFFVVKADTVQIRRIIYSRRNYDWLLHGGHA
jgi:plasmid stabilization system protein ParE